MLCTDCARPLKPVVALDIDGTLGDYHGHLATLHALYWGDDLRHVIDIFSRYDGGRTMREWWKEEFMRTDHDWEQMKLAYRQGGWKRWMRPLCDVSSFIGSIKRQGAEVWLTTTRPYLRLDNIDPDTRWWLAKQGVEENYMLYDEDKYAVLAERVGSGRVVAVLDDLPAMIEAASGLFGAQTPILLAAAHNLSDRKKDRWAVRPTIVDNHVSARREILTRVKDYQEKNA